jgi:hypothetical protein
VILVILTGAPAVSAEYSVFVEKSTYRIGEDLSVCIKTEGGRITLVFTGHYTLNMNLGDLPKGSYCFQVGTIEPQDVGSWTVILTVESLPFWGETTGNLQQNQPKAYFRVLPEIVPEFPDFGTLPIVLAVVLIAALVLLKRSRISMSNEGREHQ